MSREYASITSMFDKRIFSVQTSNDITFNIQIPLHTREHFDLVRKQLGNLTRKTTESM